MFDAKNYPSNWKEIRARILARAQNRCEKCGVPNYAFRRTNSDVWTEDVMQVEVEGACDGTLFSKIVLTIAHLDHDTTHNGDENLQALCQRCHLRHDAQLHARNAAETRRKKLTAGQGELFA